MLTFLHSVIQFKFEGIIGDGILGDIALDDISFKTGKCALAPKTAGLSVLTTKAPVTTPTIPTTTKASRRLHEDGLA